MTYLVPGLYSVIPQLDAAVPKGDVKNTPESKNKNMRPGYHLRDEPEKVKGVDDKTTLSTSAVDPTGWRNLQVLKKDSP